MVRRANRGGFDALFERAIAPHLENLRRPRMTAPAR